jgi:hypothetical protein
MGILVMSSVSWENMSKVEDLTIEQEFTLYLFAEQVKTLPLEQAQQALVNMYREMIIRDNYYRKSIR